MSITAGIKMASPCFRYIPSPIPGLSAIPGLGKMFQAKRKVDDKAELLIFVTPKVIKQELKPR